LSDDGEYRYEKARANRKSMVTHATPSSSAFPQIATLQKSVDVELATVRHPMTNRRRTDGLSRVSNRTPYDDFSSQYLPPGPATQSLHCSIDKTQHFTIPQLLLETITIDNGR
jgi:hypothetical protein